MTYAKIKTKYVRNKIKNKSFKNKKYRKYIDHLILLESYASGERFGWPGCNIVNRLTMKYEKEYCAILKELLKPEKAEEKILAVKLKKKHDRMMKRWFEEEEKRKLEKGRKEWLKLGGRP